MTKIISVVLAVMFGVLVVSFVANAVTTISGTSITLENNEVISNATDGVIQLGGIASSTSVTLLNGETITNATDGVITLTAATTSLSGALRLTGTTAGYNALATIGTLVTDTGADISANVGRLSGLQINLLSSGSTVTGFRGIDSRVTDNGTAANAVAVQGLTTKASGVSTAEAWTGNFILTMTGGKYEDVFGVASDVVIGDTASVGSASSPAVNNLVAGRFSSYVDTSATLSAVVLDVPILSILNGGANNRAKADAAVMAMIDGGSAGTVTAESAFAVRDYGDVGAGDEFDYGLNLYFNSAPFANTFAIADIRLQNGETINNSPDGVVAFSGGIKIPKDAASATDASIATTPTGLTCDATTLGTLTWVDDTDTVGAWLWLCEQTGASTYAWKQLGI